MLVEPGISAQLNVGLGRVLIELSSHSLARLVECALEGVDVVFSDNYFDLPAGRTVSISAPLPAGWTSSQAQVAFSVRSVYDSFAHGKGIWFLTRLSMERSMFDDIQTIIARMPHEEKAALSTGASPWKTVPIEQLGVPEMVDGLLIQVLLWGLVVENTSSKMFILLRKTPLGRWDIFLQNSDQTIVGLMTAYLLPISQDLPGFR
jgi:hypothetical protein